MNRDELLDNLCSCPSGIFDKVVTYLKPPAGTLSSERNSQATRAAELLNWAEHSDGPTLEELEKCYRRAIVEQPSKVPIKFWKVILTSLLVTGLTTTIVVKMRGAGILEKWELQTFDLLMQQRQVLGPDKRLLVILIDPEDTKFLNQSPEDTGQGARTLSDKNLNKLLGKLETFYPRVVGLDIFRAGNVDPEKYPQLKTILQKGNLIAICGGNSIDNRPMAASDDVPVERIGFADVLPDLDNVVRRHHLAMTLKDSKTCKTNYVEAFSLKLALAYLQKEEGDFSRKDTDDDNFIQIGNTKFSPLELHFGGYHHSDSDVSRGIQVMLNYRPYRDDKEDIAQVLSLREFFKGEFPAQWVKDRIVLIGVDNSHDYHKTPYPKKKNVYNAGLPGVFLHAQMVSHILDVVTGQRPLIWTWPRWGDVLWVGVWSFVGGWLTWIAFLRNFWQRRLILELAFFNGIAFIVLYVMCWGFFSIGGWIPLVPSVLTIVLADVTIMAYIVLSKEL
ncbi:CHASE2 domain-containing protein [Moorena producens]|uniref:CHASE2 domain-containing protein n=1 Tax=Moorena producens TaxID=1155739 RepID=UPI003C70CDB7